MHQLGGRGVKKEGGRVTGGLEFAVTVWGMLSRVKSQPYSISKGLSTACDGTRARLVRLGTEINTKKKSM